MDLSLTTAPDSTQVNAEDFLAGPRTVTITGVHKGTDEQPVNIDLAEYPGRAYRPGKSMRRVLVAAWGPDSTAYIGRRLTLFCDPDISFGRERVGGIRISEMSNLKNGRPLTLALTVSRGKRAPYVVKPLADAPVPAPATGNDAGADSKLLSDLNDALTDMGLTEREDKLAYLSGELKREIASAKDVTRDEAKRLLDGFAAAEPTLPTGAGPVPTWGADK